MKRNEKKAYPYNLLEEVFENKEYEPAELTDDMADGLAYAIAALGARREAILRMYYAEGKGAREIADYFGVTTSAIYALKRNAVMRLRRNDAICYITYGKKGFEGAARVLQIPFCRMLCGKSRRVCEVASRHFV